MSFIRKKKVIYGWNSADGECLDRIAVIDNDSSYTYRQFFRHWERYTPETKEAAYKLS